MNTTAKVAFLCGGHMARALIQWMRSHGVAASQLCVSEPVAAQRLRLQEEFGISVVADNDVAARDASVGCTLWVRQESDLDIVTALSGGGPAYFFLLAEHLAAAGAAQGLDRATSELLATQALRGAGAMIDASGDAAAQRRR